jgi:AcrR family transcriptional regulator
MDTNSFVPIAKLPRASAAMARAARRDAGLCRGGVVGWPVVVRVFTYRSQGNPRPVHSRPARPSSPEVAWSPGRRSRSDLRNRCGRARSHEALSSVKSRYRRNMSDTRPDGASRRETRANLVEVAAQLLREQGPAAVTTRAVAQAAGVQAPTIYRLFGDKDGLLDAVAEHVFATYVAGKTHVADSGDPVADLRAGWDMHIGFGLANAALFGLLTDPSRGTRSPAAAAGLEVLRARVHRVATIGRLRVAERRAVELIHAAGTGAVLTLLSTPPEDRDLDLADAMYDAVVQSILTDVPALAQDGTTAAAVAFRTVVPRLPTLTDAERALMSEWLDQATGS